MRIVMFLFANYGMWQYNIIVPFLWNDSTTELPFPLYGIHFGGLGRRILSLLCYLFALVQVLLLCSMPPCCCSYATFLTDVMTSVCEDGGEEPALEPGLSARRDCKATSFLQKGLKQCGLNRRSTEMIWPFRLNGNRIKRNDNLILSHTIHVWPLHLTLTTNENPLA